MKIRIATRKSALALWQTNFVKEQLENLRPDIQVELIPIVTTGDKTLGSLVAAGGKGLFVKELEQALLDNYADIAVHSMKDMPMEYPPGLNIFAICERTDVRDVFVSNNYANFLQLPKKSVIGTASLRRSCQLQAQRSDVNFALLRGNVDTRLRYLDEGKYDAIILAAAGLLRLGLQHRITEYLSPEICLPAAGQGAIGVECRIADNATQELIQHLDHFTTHVCVKAERAMVRELQGSCQVPIAALATLEGDNLTLKGRVGKPDGSVLLEGVIFGKMHTAETMGIQLAQDLLARGAREILSALS